MTHFWTDEHDLVLAQYAVHSAKWRAEVRQDGIGRDADVRRGSIVHDIVRALLGVVDR